MVFGLVGFFFFGISTIVGYLIPNPFLYVYIKICEKKWGVVLRSSELCFGGYCGQHEWRSATDTYGQEWSRRVMGGNYKPIFSGSVILWGSSQIYVIKETRPLFLYYSTNSIFVVTRPSWAGRLNVI